MDSHIAISAICCHNWKHKGAIYFMFAGNVLTTWIWKGHKSCHSIGQKVPAKSQASPDYLRQKGHWTPSRYQLLCISWSLQSIMSLLLQMKAIYKYIPRLQTPIHPLYTNTFYLMFWIFLFLHTRCQLCTGKNGRKICFRNNLDQSFVTKFIPILRCNNSALTSMTFYISHRWN